MPNFHIALIEQPNGKYCVFDLFSYNIIEHNISLFQARKFGHNWVRSEIFWMRKTRDDPKGKLHYPRFDGGKGATKYEKMIHRLHFVLRQEEISKLEQIMLDK